MRTYSNLRALIASFLDRNVYRDAARHWRGAGIFYVLLLAAIATLLITIKIQVSVSASAAREGPPFIAQLPRITIDHGRVTTDGPNPTLLRDRTGQVVAIIDTTAQMNGLEGTTASLLVTRNHVVYRKSAAETRMFDLARVEHFVVTREAATRWLSLIRSWLAALIAPFMLIGLCVARLVQLVVMGVAGLLIARIRSVTLDFPQAMRVGAVAMTPATLVFDLLGALDLRVPASGWLWCLVTIGYLVFGVSACRAEPAAADAPTPSGAPGT